MKRAPQGTYHVVSIAGEHVRAFVPAPLPPSPPIEWSFELQEKYNRALLALGRLDSVSTLLPTPLFLYMYGHKEAVLSSMIEGTQSSLSDLLLFEMAQQPTVPMDDVREVSNYMDALRHGVERIDGGFPLSLRLIREIHSRLLQSGRGKEERPGEFRRGQNWIGGNTPRTATFVPPPQQFVGDCMSALELFLHDKPQKTTVLLKAALMHVQFETIHPFLDGNGRVGRLLIPLILYAEKIISEPMLYISLYFKTHREQYYQLLNIVRVDGDWESWLGFFADAIAETAEQGVQTAKRLTKLAKDDEAQISTMGRISGSALRIHRVMQKYPILPVKWLRKETQLSPPTINNCLRGMEKISIVEEVTGQKRNRLYRYTRYLNIMNEGTEPLE